jgi:signal transduction histidine kinase
VLAALNPRKESAPRAPAPVVADIPALVAEIGAAGLSISLETDGEPYPLPAQVDRAAYRIAQEALTNVRRHAGAGATAKVLLVYRPHSVTIEVGDDGKGADVALVEGGNGIAGMRERAHALGGTVLAGPADGGGFEVRATFPITEENQ